MFCFAIVASFFLVNYSFSLLSLFLDFDEQILSFSFLLDSLEDSEQLTHVQLAHIPLACNIRQCTSAPTLL